MERVGEIYHKSITQQPKHWRRCRVLNPELVYRDYIKRLEMYVYPSNLILDDKIKHFIGQVALWYSNDEKFKQDLNKGLILRGNCGTGKTMLVETLFDIIEYGDKKQPILVSAIELQSYYLKQDALNIEKLKKRFLVIIDDLGTENVDVKNYGNILEPFNDLFDSRYRNRLDTIITTNLTPEKITEIYGDRIIDRFKQSFNELIFDYESFRK